MKIFNTLADLQAAPLKADSKQIVQTKGKISIGDGLGESYIITTGTPDDITKFGLVNGNIAEVYVSRVLCVTPDGTKIFSISVTNEGALTTAQVYP